MTETDYGKLGFDNVYKKRGRPPIVGALPTAEVSELDFAWAAALFEMTGTISASSRKEPTVVIPMGRRLDVAERLVHLFGGKAVETSDPLGRPRYIWKCHPETVHAFVAGALPFLLPASVRTVEDILKVEAVSVNPRSSETVIQSKTEKKLIVVPKIEVRVSSDYEPEFVFPYVEALDDGGSIVFGIEDEATVERFLRDAEERSFPSERFELIVRLTKPSASTSE